MQEQWKCAQLVLLSHFTVELPQIWYVTNKNQGYCNEGLTHLPSGSSIQWRSILVWKPGFPSQSFLP